MHNSDLAGFTAIPLKSIADGLPDEKTLIVRYRYNNADAPRQSDGVAIIYSRGNSREIYCLSSASGSSILRSSKASGVWSNWISFISNSDFQTGNIDSPTSVSDKSEVKVVFPIAFASTPSYAGVTILSDKASYCATVKYGDLTTKGMTLVVYRPDGKPVDVRFGLKWLAIK